MQTQPDQRGFGLIEVMVAMLIGMLASIVIFQVFSVSERQKRTTTGSADAQTNAAFALYAIERDAKMAGFGLEADTLAGCKKIYSYFSDGKNDPAPVNAYSFPAAISLEDIGGSNSDKITIVYYSNPAEDKFIIPSSATLRGPMELASSDVDVYSTSGCEVGQLALLQQVQKDEEYKCTVIQVTEVDHGALKIKHDAGGPPTYNPSIDYMTKNTWPTYKKDDVVRCGVSASPTTRTYELNAANELTVTDTASGSGAQPILGNIVALQAQYGVADAGALSVNRADQWTDATGNWAKGTLAVGDGNGKRIKAIRVAVAARSSEYEKPEGSACTTTTSDMVDGWSAWANLSAVKNLPDWQCYRYKVVETVIPLRNVIWANTK
jgi:type IV pilus assembly protein PilW